MDTTTTETSALRLAHGDFVERLFYDGDWMTCYLRVLQVTPSRSRRTVTVVFESRPGAYRPTTTVQLRADALVVIAGTL
jgi:hypothetical protein